MSISFSDVLLGLLFLALGGAITRYFANRRRLSYVAKPRRVLDPIDSRFPEGLEIVFDGLPIDNLVEWKIAIWNSGNVGVRSGDFLGLPEIQIVFANEKVLRAGNVVSSREVVRAETLGEDATVKNQDVSVLDTGDWIAIDVYTQADDIVENKKSRKCKAVADIMHFPKGIIRGFPPLWITKKDLIALVLSTSTYLLMGIGASLLAVDHFKNPEISSLYVDGVRWFGEETGPVFSNVVGVILAILGVVFSIVGLLLLLVAIRASLKRPPDEVVRRIYGEEPRFGFPWGRSRRA